MKKLDTRDLYKRKCELDELKETLKTAQEELKEAKNDNNPVLIDDAQDAVDSALIDFGDDEALELKELEELESEISEFMHGETMIPVDDFEDYARDFADDIGATSQDHSWPFTCIDWEQAARELAMDYTEIEYQGESYYVRS